MTMNRETWLNQIADLMAPKFEELGYPLPKYRVTFGFTSYGQKSRANGECWSPSASRDKTYEIIISITEDNPQMAACILAHELIHTAVGFGCGHKGEFVKVAKAIGLKAPFTASVPTDEFNAWADPLIEKIGPLPHARLVVGMPKFILDDSEARTIEKMLGDIGEETASSGGKTLTTKPKKQGTRMIAVDCEECGFLVRMSQKWIDEKGFPHCPDHGAKMGYADGSVSKDDENN